MLVHAPAPALPLSGTRIVTRDLSSIRLKDEHGDRISLKEIQFLLVLWSIHMKAFSFRTIMNAIESIGN